MKNQNPKLRKIPEFKTREEEAEFWDTHDFTEYQDGFRPVELRFDKAAKTTKRAGSSGAGPLEAERLGAWLRGGVVGALAMRAARGGQVARADLAQDVRLLSCSHLVAADQRVELSFDRAADGR